MRRSKRNPGSYDRKVKIQQIVSSGNSLGAGGSEVYSDYKDVWCQVTPMTGSERWDSDGRHNIKTAIFRTYYDDGISETMRLVYEEQNWNIKGISELGYKQETKITAEVIL